MRTRAERARFGNRTEALSGLGVEEEEERWLGVEGRHCEFEGAVESRMQMASFEAGAKFGSRATSPRMRLDL
jgi:hypothetical protein